MQELGEGDLSSVIPKRASPVQGSFTNTQWKQHINPEKLEFPHLGSSILLCIYGSLHPAYWISHALSESRDIWSIQPKDRACLLGTPDTCFWMMTLFLEWKGCQATACSMCHCHTPPWRHRTHTANLGPGNSTMLVVTQVLTPAMPGAPK